MEFSRIGESARLRRMTTTPLGLNESVTTPEITLQILQLGAADVLLPDTYQCGGIVGVKKAAALCEAAGVPCVFHCATNLGLKPPPMHHLLPLPPHFPPAHACPH